MICKKCGTANNDSIQFCITCGSNLKDQVNEQNKNLTSSYVTNINNNQNKKGSSKLFLIILVAFIIGIIGFVTLKYMNNNKSNNNDNSNENSSQKSNVKKIDNITLKDDGTGTIKLGNIEIPLEKYGIYKWRNVSNKPEIDTTKPNKLNATGSQFDIKFDNKGQSYYLTISPNQSPYQMIPKIESTNLYPISVSKHEENGVTLEQGVYSPNNEIDTREYKDYPYFESIPREVLFHNVGTAENLFINGDKYDTTGCNMVGQLLENYNYYKEFTVDIFITDDGRYSSTIYAEFQSNYENSKNNAYIKINCFSGTEEKNKMWLYPSGPNN